MLQAEVLFINIWCLKPALVEADLKLVVSKKIYISPLKMTKQPLFICL